MPGTAAIAHGRYRIDPKDDPHYSFCPTSLDAGVRLVDNDSAFLFAVNGTPSRELASARSSSSQEYERRK